MSIRKERQGLTLPASGSNAIGERYYRVVLSVKGKVYMKAEEELLFQSEQAVFPTKLLRLQAKE